MNITRESILGIGQDTSLVNTDWLRPNTPYTSDGKEKLIDCVEFEISHKGIEELENNIENETEYIMCFVHFEAGTENVDNIFLSVWNENADIDEPISADILDEDERQVVISYALEELKNCR